jgi:hypothetical protein
MEGFEDIMYDLTDFEKDKCMPVLLGELPKHKGKENAIKNKDIRFLFDSMGLTVSEARVRKLISYIRIRNMVNGLIATSAGYYISNDPAEVTRYMKSLSGREKAISAIRSNTLNYLETLLTHAA